MESRWRGSSYAGDHGGEIIRSGLSVVRKGALAHPYPAITLLLNLTSALSPSTVERIVREEKSK